jgi:hypothetical protein
MYRDKYRDIVDEPKQTKYGDCSCDNCVENKKYNYLYEPLPYEKFYKYMSIFEALCQDVQLKIKNDTFETIKEIDLDPRPEIVKEWGFYIMNACKGRRWGFILELIDNYKSNEDGGIYLN